MSDIARRKGIPQQQELRQLIVKFSLVIPSYNNAHELMQELPGLMHYFKEKQFDVEVIIVNDGSSKTSHLEKFCSEANYQLIHHNVNLGKGASVRTGMLQASHDIRIFTDADIPFQYQVFDDIVRQFATSNVKIVCGDRRESDYFQQTPLVRRMGSGVFSMLVNVIMLRNMGDTQCGVKAFKSEIVPVVFEINVINGFAADIEWIYRARKASIPIHWVKAEFRNAGESSVVFWKQALQMLKDLIRLRSKV